MSLTPASEFEAEKQEFVATVLQHHANLTPEITEILNALQDKSDFLLAANFLKNLIKANTPHVSLAAVQNILSAASEFSPSPDVEKLQQVFQAAHGTQTSIPQAAHTDQSLPIAKTPHNGQTEAFTVSLPGNVLSEKNSQGSISKDSHQDPYIKILFSYRDKIKKREISDFIELFNARYRQIRTLLHQRPELQQLSSINRIAGMKERATVSAIGIVYDKKETKNGNLMLTIEDPTGEIKVLINKNRPDLYRIGKDIVFDEVLGINGIAGDNIIFANSIVFPDIPVGKELKKSPDEVYAAFISDIHIGSKKFLEKEFTKFIEWLSGNVGSEQQQVMAKKVKYVFIMGDCVDGVGIFPKQEEELSVTDVKEQYQLLATYLKKIPLTIQVIMCPGNHDAMRIGEPQPIFYKDFSGPLHEITNLTLITNPGLVTVHASKNFPGFDVLMYHGYSFDYYIANVDSIRLQGGYDRADLIMKFLLQKRHLAPTHASTLYIPDPTIDPLVIDRVPDFFATGHLHKTAVSHYHNVTLICGSCWQGKTKFQEKMGHKPEPARVPIVNLKTREIKILRFDNPEDAYE